MRAKQAIARRCTIERKRRKALAEMMKYDIGISKNDELYMFLKEYRDPTVKNVANQLRKKKLNVKEASLNGSRTKILYNEGIQGKILSSI